MPDLTTLRAAITRARLAGEAETLAALAAHGPDAAARARASDRAAGYVRALRADRDPGLMEVFLAQYGLSTEEGIALMCLAEALLRVPDSPTVDALIEDKIAPGKWGRHLGQSASSLVNASTWGLLLTGKVLREGETPRIAAVLKGAVKRLGEPVIRTAVGQAMRELGRQFVLGETIRAAMARGAEDKGVTHSFDMLGEAALTQADADEYFESYLSAISAIGRGAQATIADSPGISVKLSALHPRYEALQRDRVMAELAPRLLSLAQDAAKAGIGLNVDAEEADRLEISLDVIEAVLRDESLAGWDGFGIVVQAYGQRAGGVIDWFEALAEELDCRVTLRLVKGAYWDTEIKRAQVAGIGGFPVFTRKAATDVSYLCLAGKLLKSKRIFPQFATHNAQTMAAVLEMAGENRGFEFQRLHGMGEALHRQVAAEAGTRHRVYAPVGAHRDLLAYLVRRLLENGANSSFVHQILDSRVAPEAIAADPFDALPLVMARPAPGVVAPGALFAPRANSRGWELSAPDDLGELAAAREDFAAAKWEAGDAGEAVAVQNPAVPGDSPGAVRMAPAEAAAEAVAATRTWDAAPEERARVLRRVAELYEAHHGELFALLAREAGKTIADAVAELREAVDFLRYYADGIAGLSQPARGVIVAISPWNFPLAIFTGQVAAGLAAGNGVIAKPAEATSLIAGRAVALMHEAGVPREALRLVVGRGSEVGAALVATPGVAGVAFTGSTATAQAINRAMARALEPEAALIAETGGLNAMIVDSTALPEQAVRDIVTSAFRSAGQRCSALRMLYVQDEIADDLTSMLKGAMDELRLGDPWDPATDVGPVIDAKAREGIEDYVKLNANRVLHRLEAPEAGHFVAPVMIGVDGIGDLTHEVFGPVLHVARFKGAQIGRVIAAINAKGYGLTFGLHSRIDARVAQVTSRVRAGNIYVNRNQIGAIVGSQPFGGEGLSGTGPKAGGPAYLHRLTRPGCLALDAATGVAADPGAVQAALDTATQNEAPVSVADMPGPTGESNRLSSFGRGVVLCLGPGAAAARDQARIVRASGAVPVMVAPGLGATEGVAGVLAPEALTGLTGLQLVADWSGPERLRAVRQALSAREGPIVLLAAGDDLGALSRIERHLSVDTTAAGGNARLLSASG